MRLADIPSPPLWLGLAGLIPFAGMTGLAAHAEGAQRTIYLFYLAGYGVVILSFVGALHWGVAMMLTRASDAERWKLMTWSVVPALVAWAALPFPPRQALLLLIATFWVHFLMDRAMAARHLLPQWYVPLRLILTVGATGCMAIGAMF